MIHARALRGPERIREPAAELKVDQPLHAFRLGGGGALAKLLGRLGSVPGRRVDQPERIRALRIKPAEGLRDTAAHRGARNGCALPADMIHQLGQIAREQLRRVRHVRARGAAMAAAIEGQQMDVARKLLHHAVPHALIERERMNQRKARRVRVLRGPQRIDDRATVGGRENPGLSHRSSYWLYAPFFTVEHICPPIHRSNHPSPGLCSRNCAASANLGRVSLSATGHRRDRSGSCG